MSNISYQATPSHFTPFNCSQLNLSLFNVTVEEWRHISKKIVNFTDPDRLCLFPDEVQGQQNDSFSPIFEEKHVAGLKAFNRFVVDRGNLKDFFSEPCGFRSLAKIFENIVKVVRRYLNPIACDGTSIEGDQYLKGSVVFTLFRKSDGFGQNQASSSSFLSATCEILNPKNSCPTTCVDVKMYGISQKDWWFANEMLFRWMIVMGTKKKMVSCIPNPILTREQAKAMDQFLDLFTSNEGIKELIRCRGQNFPCEAFCYYVSLPMLSNVALSLFKTLSMELDLFEEGRISRETELLLPLPKRNVRYQTMPAHFDFPTLSPTFTTPKDRLNCSRMGFFLYNVEINEWKTIAQKIETLGDPERGCLLSDEVQGRANDSLSPIVKKVHIEGLRLFKRFVIDRGDSKDFFSEPCYRKGFESLVKIFENIVKIVKRYLHPVACDETPIHGNQYLKGGIALKLFPKSEGLVQNGTSFSTALNGTCEMIEPKERCPATCLDVKIYGIPQEEWLFASELLFRNIIFLDAEKKMACSNLNPLLTKAQAKAMDQFLDLFLSNEGIQGLMSRCGAQNLRCKTFCYSWGPSLLGNVAWSLFKTLSTELDLFERGRISKQTELILPLPKRADH